MPLGYALASLHFAQDSVRALDIRGAAGSAQNDASQTRNGRGLDVGVQQVAVNAHEHLGGALARDGHGLGQRRAGLGLAGVGHWIGEVEDDGVGVVRPGRRDFVLVQRRYDQV